MATRLTGIDIEGDILLRKALDHLPDEAIDQAADDISQYLLNVLRMYPSKNYVTRASAYGQTFQSDKQRKWFFWALNSSAINVPYRRTQELARSWKIEGSGRKTIIVNETEAAHWTMSESQSRHEAMVGWKKVSTTIEEHAAKINKIFEGAVNKILRKLKLI